MSSPPPSSRRNFSTKKELVFSLTGPIPKTQTSRLPPPPPPESHPEYQPQTHDLMLRLQKSSWPQLQIKDTSSLSIPTFAKKGIETQGLTKAAVEGSMLHKEFMRFIYIASKPFEFEEDNHVLRQMLDRYFRTYSKSLTLTDSRDANAIQTELQLLLWELEYVCIILKYSVEESKQQLGAKLKEFHNLNAELTKCKIIDEYIASYDNNKGGGGGGWLYPVVVAAAFSASAAALYAFKRLTLHSSH